ncbi:hypothetical protein K491DRAFT_690412 [Lophiostoma macrostomum CBS 122681]|uniref:Kinesin light chain n=1 Tax=Lophiostoma macrostomum CBS 122681 TaxID=1314788 RepID=A0A6A6TFE6_9PLEO|nr:hypothetical protein K491DRAFT_690412 [Lophiostoma macrostomum CBS 122681]
MASSDRPLRCEDYHVAWICAVADLELLPARLMLDSEHPTPPYETHFDENTYVCGIINGHTVVIATCPPGETGNVNAGRLTGPMFKTFPNIRMTVLVGIGGGIPRAVTPDEPLEDVHLGDVVVGWPGDGKPACVYHDRGRAKVDGSFEMVGTMQDPDWRLVNALGILVSDYELGRTHFDEHFARLRNIKQNKKFMHPGLEHDRLFQATYHHQGGYASRCAPCDQSHLVQRPPRAEEDKNELVFHRGRVATGNSVIQDAELRDRISARCGEALCIEMEAAGVAVNRRCLVIRGISDYADSHKSDLWQSYAAGKAAAFTRELLCRIQPSAVKDMEGIKEGPWVVPFVRPQSFTGRDSQLNRLEEHIASKGGNGLAVYGLGGCGKTALALEMAYRVREKNPTCAVLWVPAVSQESFELAYREIGIRLRIPGIADDKADVKQLVKMKLSDEGFGEWLLIIDNADDESVLFGGDACSADPLVNYLPLNRRGTIIFTTRTLKAAIKLADSNAVELGELTKMEAKTMLHSRLLPAHHHELRDGDVVGEFLDMLAYFALALVQATAFINAQAITLSRYMFLFRQSKQDAIRLLSEEFANQGRYPEQKNPVATTWYISFQHIQRNDGLAAAYLSFMACVANTDIPVTMLSTEGTEMERLKAIGTLKAYAFISERQPQHDTQTNGPDDPRKAFDVHPLVHMAMQSWLKAHNKCNIWMKRTLRHLRVLLPDSKDSGDYHATKEVWLKYIPHAIHAADMPEAYYEQYRMRLLYRIGICEYELGRYRASEISFRKCLERSEAVLGRKHPKTLSSLSTLGGALTEQGKYEEAEELFWEVLASWTQQLGKKHPDTLSNMVDLATVLSLQEKNGEAEMMDREVLTLRLETLGWEHPDTLLSMNNLAVILDKQGKYSGAELMLRKTLALREKILGKKHLDTLFSKTNLAGVLSKQERHAEAETMHRETLVLWEEVLGQEHPDTLSSVFNLGLALYKQHRYEDALPLFKRAYEGECKTLGPDHHNTQNSLEWYELTQQEVDERSVADHGKAFADSETKSSHPGPSGSGSVTVVTRDSDNVADLLDPTAQRPSLVDTIIQPMRTVAVAGPKDTITEGQRAGEAKSVSTSTLPEGR